MTPVALLPKVRSQALLDACAHMPCTLRIGTFIGLPCAPQDTNVGCHLPVLGKGMSTKVSDLFVASGCKTCHDILDGKIGVDLRHRFPAAYMERLLMALCETQARWVDMGLLPLPEDGTVV